MARASPVCLCDSEGLPIVTELIVLTAVLRSRIRPSTVTMLQNTLVPSGVPLPVGPSYPGAALHRYDPQFPVLPETTS